MGDCMGAGKVIKNFAAQLFIQSLWNFASEQKPGITFVLSSRSRKKALVRPPLPTFNTNPFLASFLTGVLVREWHKDGVKDVTHLLESSLAAQGDDLYWRVLRPTALLAGMFLALLGQPLFALGVFLLGFNFFAQGERLLGYVRGFKRGRKALPHLIASLGRTKRIILPVAGVLIGLLAGAMIFRLDSSSFLLRDVEWFIFLPLLAVSFVFAVLRLSVLLNLVVNLLVVIVLGALI